MNLDTYEQIFHQTRSAIRLGLYQVTWCVKQQVTPQIGESISREIVARVITPMNIAQFEHRPAMFFMKYRSLRELLGKSITSLEAT